MTVGSDDSILLYNLLIKKTILMLLLTLNFLLFINKQFFNKRMPFERLQWGKNGFHTNFVNKLTKNRSYKVLCNLFLQTYS